MMAAVNKNEAEILKKIPEMRTAFTAKYAEAISQDQYDSRDLQRLQSDDAYAGCFLRALKAGGDVTKSLEGINESLKFRKTFGLNDLKEDDFPVEMTSRKAMQYNGNDVDGHPLMYIDVKQNVATGAEQVAILKKYIAFYFDIHYQKNPGQMCVVILDMSGASTSNVSIDVTKFIIACFTTYFPSYLSYMINYEMPFLLSATWKIISAFLSAEQRKKVQMVKKKDICKYIPEEHLWSHMK